MKKLLFGTILLALSLGAAAKSITVFKNVTTAVTGVTAITPTASQRVIVRSALISSSANAFVSIYYGTTPTAYANDVTSNACVSVYVAANGIVAVPVVAAPWATGLPVNIDVTGTAKVSVNLNYDIDTP